jgi:O-antigen/teichoic acid export membrane protein
LLVSLNVDIFKHFISREAYWVGLDIVPVLLLANVFLGIYLNQSIWYKLSNQTKFGAYISLIGAGLTIIINWLFIPEFGFRASAWATMIVYAVQMVLSYFLGQKYYPIKYNRRKFTMYVGGSIVLYFIANALMPDSITWLSLLIGNIFVLLFIRLVFFVEGISPRALLKRIR